MLAETLPEQANVHSQCLCELLYILATVAIYTEMLVFPNVYYSALLTCVEIKTCWSGQALTAINLMDAVNNFSPFLSGTLT